jgi:hypothetical protein
MALSASFFQRFLIILFWKDRFKENECSCGRTLHVSLLDVGAVQRAAGEQGASYYLIQMYAALRERKPPVPVEWSYHKVRTSDDCR